MLKQRIEGWLFDIDELGPVVALWVYTDAGRLVRLTDEFHPPIYAAGARDRLVRLSSEFDRRGLITGVRWATRREFWSGEEQRVLALHIADSSQLARVRELAAALEGDLAFYNLDLPAAQYYLYLKRLHPLGRLTAEADEAGNVFEVAPEGDPWAVDYELPALRVLTLRAERARPVSAETRILIEGEALRLGDGARAIEAFNDALARRDPDLILSEGGDSVIFPALLRVAERERVALALDRDRVLTRRKIVTEGRTYFSYGRIIYKGPSYPLFGRWHLDRGNSFLLSDGGLEALVEIARLSQVPVQRLARTSPGSAMTSIEISRAIAAGILIPWRKAEPERYKTALQLLTVDKGGLTYQPRLGSYENVAEIDFAAMYPSIMVAHNISPETVLCACCREDVVPEAGYNVCRRRRGLIPQTIGPLIARRRLYKDLARAATDERARARFEARRAALKWCLVSSFGYLGYKNARFGRVEAHEAVTAWGREHLLRAKELAEAEGFELLHALTDSLWLRRAGATRDEVLALCRRITAETGIEMCLEGIYRWITFLPSTVNPRRPVASRYFGVFEDGTLKVRGLACRRRDTPRFVRESQLELLAILARAQTLEERAALAVEARAALEARSRELERGAVAPARLAIERRVSRELGAYAVETRTALAVRAWAREGVKIHPGEGVRFVIADAGARDPSRRVIVDGEEGASYDRAEYLRLLRAAAAEVLPD